MTELQREQLINEQYQKRIALNSELDKLYDKKLGRSKKSLAIKKEIAKTDKEILDLEKKQSEEQKERLSINKMIDTTLAKTAKRERKSQAVGKDKVKWLIKDNRIKKEDWSLTSRVTGLQTKSLGNVKRLVDMGYLNRDIAQEIVDIHDDINSGILTEEGIKSKSAILEGKIADEVKYRKENWDNMTAKEKIASKAREKTYRDTKQILDLEGERLNVMGAVNQAQSTAKKGAESMANAIGIGSIAPLGIVMGILAMFNAQQEAIADEFGAMGVTEFRDELAGASQEFTRMGLEGKEALSTAKSLSVEFGIGFEEATAMADSVGNIAKSTGMTTGEASKLVGMFTTIGGLTEKQATNLAKSAESLAVANGVAPGVILEDIAKNSEVFAKFSGSGADELARGAIQARKLGIELSDVASSMEGMLNFQDSLNNEIEASILLGRNVNLQKARELALSGDIEGFQKEILDVVGSQAEFDKMNILQKQALAKATGMGVEQLSKMVSKEKEAVTLAGELGKQDLDKLVPEETITATAELLGNLKAMGMELAESLGPTIEFIVGAFTKVLGVFEKLKFVLPILITLFVAYKIAAMGLAVAKTVEAIAGFFSAAAKGSEATAGFGMPAMIGLAVGGVGLLLSAMAAGAGIAASMAGDMYSPADGKTQISTKEGGLFEMSPNDDILAGPGLAGAAAGGGNVVANVNTSRMEKETKELKSEISNMRRDFAGYFGFGGTVAGQIGSKVKDGVSVLKEG